MCAHELKCFFCWLPMLIFLTSVALLPILVVFSDSTKQHVVGEKLGEKIFVKARHMAVYLLSRLSPIRTKQIGVSWSNNCNL